MHSKKFMLGFVVGLVLLCSLAHVHCDAEVEEIVLEEEPETQPEVVPEVVPDIVSLFFDGTQLSSKAEKLAAGYADDFEISFVGPYTGPATGMKMNKEEGMGAMASLVAAFPDFTFNYGNKVPVKGSDGGWGAKITVHGTHTGGPYTPMPDVLPAIEPTGKDCTIGPELFTMYTNDEGKATKLTVEPLSEGALVGPPGFYVLIGGSLEKPEPESEEPIIQEPAATKEVEAEKEDVTEEPAATEEVEAEKEDVTEEPAATEEVEAEKEDVTEEPAATEEVEAEKEDVTEEPADKDEGATEQPADEEDILIVEEAVDEVETPSKDIQEVKEDDKAEPAPSPTPFVPFRQTYLTPENYEEITMGKTVFIKFFAPWCQHCKKMAPEWNKMAQEFKDDENLLVARVDCSDDSNRPLCNLHDVKGFPTLKYGDPIGALTLFEGARDFDSLMAHAKSIGQPRCSPMNLELCDEETAGKIMELESLTIAELRAKIEEKYDEMGKIEAEFATQAKELQTKYESLSSTSEKVVEDVKNGGLDLMKSVRVERMKTGTFKYDAPKKEKKDRAPREKSMDQFYEIIDVLLGVDDSKLVVEFALKVAVGMSAMFFLLFCCLMRSKGSKPKGSKQA